MKKVLIAFSIVLIFSITLWAEERTSDLIMLRFFAYTPVEVHDRNGRYREISPRIFEYHELGKWDPSEASLSPPHIDIVGVVLRPSNVNGRVKVNFELSAKVGTLAESGYGVANIEYGQKTAQWGKPEFKKVCILTPRESNLAQPVILKNIDLKAIQQKYFKQGKWPFQIRVRMWLSCGKCDSKEDLVSYLDIIPGD